MLDLVYESARGIDRSVDLEAVLLPYMKVVGTVARCGVDAACAGLICGFVFEPNIELDLGVRLAERHVFAVYDQRRSIKPCVFRFETVEL